MPGRLLRQGLDGEGFAGVDVLEFHGEAGSVVIGGPLVFVVAGGDEAGFSDDEVLDGFVEVCEVDDHAFGGSEFGGGLFHRSAGAAHFDGSDVE